MEPPANGDGHDDQCTLARPAVEAGFTTEAVGAAKDTAQAVMKVGSKRCGHVEPTAVVSDGQMDRRSAPVVRD
jgi:hypothetical protein